MEHLWAVFGPNGHVRFEGFGQTEGTAKIRFCKEMDGPWALHGSSWSHWERKGFRCCRVTVSKGSLAPETQATPPAPQCRFCDDYGENPECLHCGKSHPPVVEVVPGMPK